MKLLVIALILSIILADICLASKQVDQLRIGVKHRPEKCERKSKPFDNLRMHYTGTLQNGDKFDSSVDRNQPFDFQIGKGMVIKGWDQGLLGMCVGEKRKLTIPPHLGYGASGSGKIPGNSVLIFEVELIDILNKD
ncbi:FKBP-type peptidylprolyl cis-trans isomerase [Tieghemostelium lacteum]|uniref:peptidylprolyl isomerase n=1 Tax=Tieghemostelium lacteum TaxID=361077 RepID=A0A152A9D6_TIELA|nr:FKBP-type peptidylprolyl cis-trans isomerase [Tieghemostelium lacteum]|eukprot:KYR02741.1 FKBP-type peptidylprolyl cis-trans isomerase [Tieghemostelium lacteum]